MIIELRGHGHTYPQIAHILNEQKWVPLGGGHTSACRQSAAKRRPGPVAWSKERACQAQIAMLQGLDRGTSDG